MELLTVQILIWVSAVVFGLSYASNITYDYQRNLKKGILRKKAISKVVVKKKPLFKATKKGKCTECWGTGRVGATSWTTGRASCGSECTMCDAY